MRVPAWVLAAAAGLAAAGWRMLNRGRAAEQALLRDQDRVQYTLDSIGDGVVATGPDGRVIYLNAAAESLTGWTARGARGLPLDRVLHLLDEATRAPLAIDAPTAPTKRSARLASRSGHELPVAYSVSAIREEPGRASGWLIIFHDESEKRALAEQLTRRARLDELTGLVNRRALEASLGSLLETAQEAEEGHALLWIDLEQLKTINRGSGHAAGDEVLRQVAALLEPLVRESDTLARVAGDEFAVLLEVCPLEQAVRIAQEIIERIREHRFEWGEDVFSIGASVAVVPVDRSAGGVDTLVAAAEALAYRGQENGRSRLQVFQRPEGGPALGGDLRLLGELHAALEEGRFRLLRQKIAPLAAGGQAHYEVLLRMLDAEGRLLPPTAFLPTAERYKLHAEVDRWVVAHLLDALAGAGADATIYAINLSGASLNDATFAGFLQRELARTGVAPTRLCFEITESIAIANLARTAELMRELRLLGCRFALDDFGIGMSSFAYLKHLPVNWLKIDGSFVRELAHEPMDAAIVEAINRVAHVLGMQTIAEYVRNQETLARLKRLGVDYVQGDAVGLPEPLVPGEQT